MEKENLKQKFLQLFILGYKKTKVEEDFLKLIKNGLGGVIFFAENIENRKHFKKTIKAFNKLSKETLFLSIDQEGGLVERTIFLDEKVEYLTPKALSNLSSKDISIHYDILARDLIDLGINLNFAPVLDVNSNPQNPIINIRSFGNNAKIVNKCSQHVIKAFKRRNLLSCGKHYAGHGDTFLDSHINMPSIDIDFENFYKKHLICFENAIKNKIDTIMISHIHFSFFDKEKLPASLSKNAISFLKNDMNFSGLIFSDDMVMGGITKHFGLEESLILGLNAGIDNFIFRNYSNELENAINNIVNQALVDKKLYKKIINAYEKTIKFKNKKIKKPQNQPFNCNFEQKKIDKIAAKSIKINSNINNLIIKKESKIKIISFNYSEIYNLSNNKFSLKTLLETHYPTDEILYPINPTQEDIERILSKINNEDVVIFMTYNPQIYPMQIEFFNKITNEKFLVNCASDNDMKLSYKAKSIISLSCPKSPSLKALAELLIEK